MCALRCESPFCAAKLKAVEEGAIHIHIEFIRDSLSRSHRDVFFFRAEKGIEKAYVMKSGGVLSEIGVDWKSE